MISKKNSPLLLDGQDEDGEAGLVVLDNGQVMCVTCGKTLCNMTTGKRHIRETHRPTQRAQCRICKKTYQNERSRNNHYKLIHGVSAKQMTNFVRVPADNQQPPTYQESYELDPPYE